MATSIAVIPVATAKGTETSLGDFSGKVVLLVNVASKCGFTPQYAGLEALYQEFKDRGLVVLGAPCNDFGGQEPGTIDEIQAFCSTNYNVTFPLLAKLHAKGPEQHPLYAALTEQADPSGDVKWNFEKFLIDRSGNLVGRFDSRVTPDSEELRLAVQKALG